MSEVRDISIENLFGWSRANQSRVAAARAEAAAMGSPWGGDTDQGPAATPGRDGLSGNGVAIHQRGAEARHRLPRQHRRSADAAEAGA